MQIRRIVYGAMPWKVSQQLAKHRLAAARAVWDRAIAWTPPMPCRPAADFEVHSLLGTRHVGMCLWAVKSFMAGTGQPHAVVLHDDGTLTARDVAKLHAHLPGVRVILRSEADRLVEPHLARHPHLRAYRFATLGRTDWGRRMSVFSLKLLDFTLLGTARKILALDTDVLFFRRPQEIIDWIGDDGPGSTLYCFEDYRPTFHAGHLLTGFEPIQEPRCYFNSGLICIDRQVLDFDRLDDWIGRNAEAVDRAYTFEQSAYNHWIHGTPRHAPLPPSYSFNYTDEACIATHFGIKPLFYRNLPRVLKALRRQAAPGPAALQKSK